MGKTSKPRRGSLAYNPRKRAKRETPILKHWPEGDGEPKLQGFAGYKAGMTHLFVIDGSAFSTTSGQEIVVPATVVEVPPLKVVGIRLYTEGPYGMTVLKEIWTEKHDKELHRRVTLPEKMEKPDIKAFKALDPDEVRVIVHTQPYTMSGVPKKSPEVMEIRVGGGSVDKRRDYALTLLGKEINFNDFQAEGAMVDVIAITKGKGFQGRVKRFGLKLLTHKNSKHRRMIGTQGPWHPAWIMPQIPNSGQMGYHKRTEYNKQVLKFGKDPAEINPKGGFVNYGQVKGSYVLIHGSIPGVTKRLIRFRDPVRKPSKDSNIHDVTFVSTASKQGR